MGSLTYAVLFSTISFLYYGFACLVSPRLIKEFERYGLPQFRILTGILQLFGAAGLVLGLFYPWLGVIAAAGLTILMMAGFVTRIKIKDSLLQTLPSFIYMVLNAYISSSFYLLIATKGE